MKKLSLRDDLIVSPNFKSYHYLDSSPKYKYDENRRTRTDEVEGTKVDVLAVNHAGERKGLSVTIPKVIDATSIAFGTAVQFKNLTVTPYFDRRTNSLEFSVKAEDMIVPEKK